MISTREMVGFTDLLLCLFCSVFFPTSNPAMFDLYHSAHASNHFVSSDVSLTVRIAAWGLFRSVGYQIVQMKSGKGQITEQVQSLFDHFIQFIRDTTTVLITAIQFAATEEQQQQHNQTSPPPTVTEQSTSAASDDLPPVSPTLSPSVCLVWQCGTCRYSNPVPLSSCQLLCFLALPVP